MQKLQMSDGHTLFFKTYENEQAKAVIQLVHGSCEHIKRYDELAAYFVSQGFVVYGNDHRGHGESAKDASEYGYFGEKNGWERLVKDLKEFNQFIAKKHPNLPIIMVGHSMGSFLARHYAILYGETLAGLILSGTAHQSKALLKFGCTAAQIIRRLKGSRHRSKLMNDLSYGSFNRMYKQPRTTHEWLTRDEKVVDLFLQDEACGFVFTTAGFYDMFSGLVTITDPEKIKATPKDLPIFLIAGEHDPVGECGKTVKKAYEAYLLAGMKHVKLKLYPHMRHEIFNEFEKQHVYEDMNQFIKTECL